jgi:hypothetical protein
MSEIQSVEPLTPPARCGDYREIPISSIHVGSRRRGLRPDKVLALRESIETFGLYTPISVTEEPAGEDGHPSFGLVFGNHRLQACMDLGWPTITARVLNVDRITRELAEIDENLCRAELTVLERAEHLLRRKELYEELHPETRQHVAGAAAANAAMDRGDATDKLSVASFAVDTAGKAGFTDRAIRREISRAKRIDHAVRDRIRDNPAIADNGTELDALGSLKPEDQHSAIELIENQKCKSVKAAQALFRGRATAGRPKPVTTNFKTAGPAVTVIDIPQGKLNDATADRGGQELIQKLRDIVTRMPQPDRGNLIACLDKLGPTRADRLAACLT